MVKGKIEIRKIENAKSRQVTFSKRRNGLLKKSFELSVLCEAEVALIVFTPRAKLYEFSSSSTSIQKTIERYQNYNKDVHVNYSVNYKAIEQDSQQLKHEDAILAKKILNLEASKRNLMGEGLESCSIDELQTVENQLEKSLLNIREKKNLLYREMIEQLKQKEKSLLEENEVLCEKCGSGQLELQNQQREISAHETSPNSHEVETELRIGRPERR